MSDNGSSSPISEIGAEDHVTIERLIANSTRVQRHHLWALSAAMEGTAMLRKHQRDADY